jgi:hypothetical protein
VRRERSVATEERKQGGYGLAHSCAQRVISMPGFASARCA